MAKDTSHVLILFPKYIIPSEKLCASLQLIKLLTIWKCNYFN